MCPPDGRTAGGVGEGRWPDAWFSNFSVHQSQLRLVKHGPLCPTPDLLIQNLHFYRDAVDVAGWTLLEDKLGPSEDFVWGQWIHPESRCEAAVMPAKAQAGSSRQWEALASF